VEGKFSVRTFSVKIKTQIFVGETKNVDLKASEIYKGELLKFQPFC